ncbi:C39 family peptidase [Halomonas sp. MCCC 1A17488]|uniref:C39 family peptidase n=1 Tax=Billgrantia sulfidoxydans TaxID=2733484 RepID=A0ABX7WBJ4_9GAMM|nr:MULTISPECIES: C39 family peptidase [Halomonas]MCE8017270.1 C39 family peptidase [Halomonas sp. MCCC 1A17488]MCG3240603.1 C39 family peptidase [Halomonas sp. MCCC 1A17488]QPP49546.1 C39 family peptidase [Halomonas sp. SS10-MC5]QTP56902.1 C39 family peptidase [Halomonas sulfidoxydans]
MTGTLRRLGASSACLVIGLAALPVQAAGVTIALNGGFGSVTVAARSHHEMRWDGVVAQQYDYSCGAAAVATLLTYHYDRPTTEADVFESMIRVGEVEQIREQGFSMLDMKRYLDGQGLNSDGFRVGLDDLERIGIPAITLINTGGYRHFVVLKGMDANSVLLGDPAVGTVAVPRAHFESIWSGLVLGARAEVEIAKANFNHERDWRIRPAAPVGSAVDRADVASLLLQLPAINELGR